MKTRMRAALALCAAICVLLAGAAGAQGSSGVLSGRVTDPSGGAMPGVTVTATHPATGESRTAVTNTEGVYRLQALPVGTWSLSYQLDGFKTISRNGILVEVAVPRTVDITLEVG